MASLLPTHQREYQTVNVSNETTPSRQAGRKSTAVAVAVLCGLAAVALFSGFQGNVRPNSEIVRQLHSITSTSASHPTRVATAQVRSASKVTRRFEGPSEVERVKNEIRKVAVGTLAGIVATGSIGDGVAPAYALDVPAVQVQASASAVGGASSMIAPAVVDLPTEKEWRYSDFIGAVSTRQISKVQFEPTGAAVSFTTTGGREGHVTLPNDRDLIDILIKNDVDIYVENPNEGFRGFMGFLSNLALPAFFLAGLVLLTRNREDAFGGGANGPMAMGKAKDKFQEIPETGVTFADVAGVDGAKLELQEVVDFLKNPGKYTDLGAKIPQGALLAGPPGTGKTLLAKAVAGEAGVPFFACSASEFVELFVGVGASRVRDLFKRAKEKAPCIVFIDEIDAVGRQRGAGMGGGNDEREQTINQLLTEMDGFEGNSGVIVLAATNRPDVLDSALLRPGRFDRQITVDRPDLEGRKRILAVHSKGKTLAKNVDLAVIARRTPGMTGADLENLMNEAAILTARRGKSETGDAEIADALEKIIAGAERPGAMMSDQKKRLVAYHEAGHALVGALMPGYDPVAKISIVPRGAAGGLTFFAPSEERLESGLYTRAYLENQMAVALGGRIAEELIFGEDNITTGASGDFQQVTRTAKLMVTQLGFSERLGQVAVAQGGQSFLGQQMGQPAAMSAMTADIVDSEVQKLVETAYRRAKDLTQTNIKALHAIANALLDKETIDGEECAKIIADCEAQMYNKADAPGVTIPYQVAGSV